MPEKFTLRRRSSLSLAQPRTRRRLLHPACGPHSSAGERRPIYIQPNKKFRLPAACRGADRHDRSRHRHRAVSRLSARTARAGATGRTGSSSASAARPPTFFTARNLSHAGGRPPDTARHGLLARPGAQDLCAGQDVGAGRAVLGLACRTAQASTSAATPAAWRKMSMSPAHDRREAGWHGPRERDRLRADAEGRTSLSPRRVLRARNDSK